MEGWISRKYLDPKRLSRRFRSANPFPYIELKAFFREERLIPVYRALHDEQFFEKEADLFKLKQTRDFEGTESKGIKGLRDFLISKEFRDYMKAITGISLKLQLDMNGSLYEYTDFLLCHDDQLDSRKIAFLIYLADMEKDEGGSLNLFSQKNGMPDKVVKKIIPKFNTFAFFEVSKASFHEVEEVYVRKSRLAIGGWFHA